MSKTWFYATPLLVFFASCLLGGATATSCFACRELSTLNETSGEREKWFMGIDRFEGQELNECSKKTCGPEDPDPMNKNGNNDYTVVAGEYICLKTFYQKGPVDFIQYQCGTEEQIANERICNGIIAKLEVIEPSLVPGLNCRTIRDSAGTSSSIASFLTRILIGASVMASIAL